MQRSFQFVLDNYLNGGRKVSSLEECHKVICQSLKKEISAFFPTNHWIVKGSTGQGNRSMCPWVAALNKKVTTSTMYGVYIVYLFRSDMSGFYLSLNQGITNFQIKYKNKKYEYAMKVADYFRSEIPHSIFSTDEIVLLSHRGERGFGYERTNILSKFYPSHGFTDTELQHDLLKMKDVYDFLIDHFPQSATYEDVVEKVIDFVSVNSRKAASERFLLNADEAEFKISKALEKDSVHLEGVEIKLQEVEPKVDISKSLAALDDEQNVNLKIDYLKKAEADAKIGLQGEKLAIQFEKDRLCKIGLSEYSEKIKWVAMKNDSAGYDIDSFDLIHGQIHPIKIEVKSTSSKIDREFYVSLGEVLASKKFNEYYFVYRIYNINSVNPKIYRVRGKIEDNFSIDPITFLAKYRGASLKNNC